MFEENDDEDDELEDNEEGDADELFVFVSFEENLEKFALNFWLLLIVLAKLLMLWLSSPISLLDEVEKLESRIVEPLVHSMTVPEFCLTDFKDLHNDFLGVTELSITGW
ncbi:unnamed protein product [[Candida] boidinii]|nr:unnamed protein product [[Candida] boidinii]